MNNRQNGRRGRGRGGNNGGIRPMGGGGGQDRGNRIDNRARGNANQLHEKYKTLARDAQTQGDRVMTEYYLQFADHYFRVLAETRGRFDEQRPQQRRDFADDYDGDDQEGGDDLAAEGGQQGDREPRREYRRDDRPRDDRPQQDARPRDDRDRQDDRQQDGRRVNGYHNGAGQEVRGQDARGQDGREREQRYERRDRDERGNGGYQPAARADEAAEPEFRAEGESGEQPRRARGRPRRERPAEAVEAGGDRLNPPSFLTEAMLPPAAPAPEAEDAPAPRRRVRRPRAETGEAVAEV